VAADGLAVEFQLLEQGFPGRAGGDEVLPAEGGEPVGAAVALEPQPGDLLDAALDAEFSFSPNFCSSSALTF